MMALVVVAALLASLGLWYSKAAELATAKSSSLDSKEASLAEHSKAIKTLKENLAEIESKKDPFVDAVTFRAYWTLIFDDLSKRMDTDLMWVTVLEPLAQGQSVTEDLASDAESAAAAGVTLAAQAQNSAGGEQKEFMIDAISLKGLYRDNDRGADIVVDYLANLRESTFFDLENRDTGELLKKADPVAQYSGQWEMVLPLKARIQFTK